MQATITHAEWSARYNRMKGIAERIDRMRTERAKRIFSDAYGWRDTTGANGVTIHNASIDDNLRGWCSGPDGRRRLRAAKLAKHVWDSAFEGYRILDQWCRRVRTA